MAWKNHKPDQERRQIHVKVCEDSWKAWDRFAMRQGCTLAALIDAFGHALAEVEEMGTTEALSKAPYFMAALDSAREISWERKRRA